MRHPLLRTPPCAGDRVGANLALFETSLAAAVGAIELRVMTWHRRLPKTFFLKDGRKVATLAQARDVLLSLPAARQADPIWQSAAELLVQTAYRNRHAVISDIGNCLLEILVAHRLI
jgi:hypothetical protein